MIKKITIILTLAIVGIVLMVIFSDNTENSETNTHNNTNKVSIIPKGGRLLGVGYTEGSIGANKTFKAIKEAGIDFIEFPLQWDEIESKNGNFTSDLLPIANQYYPSQNIKIILTLNFIDTNTLHIPSDLRNKPFDAPEIIERYKKLVDYVFSELRDVDIIAISIGNEIDAYLSTDEMWGQYYNFFKAVSEYIKLKKPGLKIGCKITHEGITESRRKESLKINQHSDIIMVNYYPIKKDSFNVKEISLIESDIVKILSLYPDKKIYLTETGYPSSLFLGSSEESQSDYIKEMFRIWDKHNSRIELIDFVWLHDLSKSELNMLTNYYGFSAKGFNEFLKTLGLRTNNGKNKPGFVTLKTEAKARGW